MVLRRSCWSSRVRLIKRHQELTPGDAKQYPFAPLAQSPCALARNSSCSLIGIALRRDSTVTLS